MSVSYESPLARDVKNASGAAIALGVLMILGGAVAIVFALGTTLATVAFIGLLLVGAGVVEAVHAITQRALWPGLLVAVVYGVTGGLILARPGATAVTLTLVLCSLYFIVGLTRVATALVDRYPRWGWGLVGGLISVALGVYLFANLPAVALWLIGTLVGVELIIAGAELIAVGGAGRRLVARAERFEERVPVRRGAAAPARGAHLTARRSPPPPDSERRLPH